LNFLNVKVFLLLKSLSYPIPLEKIKENFSTIPKCCQYQPATDYHVTDHCSAQEIYDRSQPPTDWQPKTSFSHSSPSVVYTSAGSTQNLQTSTTTVGNVPTTVSSTVPTSQSSSASTAAPPTTNWLPHGPLLIVNEVGNERMRFSFF